MHPTGNANVRAVLSALEDAKWLSTFQTTIGFSSGSRSYQIAPQHLKSRPWREGVRLCAKRLKWNFLTKPERGWASIDAVYKDLDRAFSRFIEQRHHRIRGVYCYEDGALQSFLAAKRYDIRRFYDLPIAYWETSQRLLRQEAERLPAWEPTLGGTRDSPEKLERKAREMELAELVICPSRFVLESIPPALRASRQCIVAEFGSPPVLSGPAISHNERDPLRVLFAGSMTQRKGLADVFAAMKQLASRHIKLVVMGSLQAPMEFYRAQYADFQYEPPRPHGQVLELMRSCDVLVLPSIVEGRALVQQEALSCGLPIIVTANAGAEDLVDDGKTGFVVPIRSPAAIAEKIAWFADHRSELPGMAEAAQARAAATTWANYQRKVIAAIQHLLEKP